jgi:hypothetical protein
MALGGTYPSVYIAFSTFAFRKNYIGCIYSEIIISECPSRAVYDNGSMEG